MAIMIISKGWLKSLVRGEDQPIMASGPDPEDYPAPRYASGEEEPGDVAQPPAHLEVEPEEDELPGEQTPIELGAGAAVEEPLATAEQAEATDSVATKPAPMRFGERGAQRRAAAAAEDSEEDGEEEVVSQGTDDILAPAYDLEDGELIEEDLLAPQKTKLPWSSRVQSAKEFFSAEVLYRFDLLEEEERRELAGKFRIEIKGYQGGVWTMDLGDQLSIVNRREDADIVMTMYQRDFLQLVNGELNPQLALLAQKLKVSGDLHKAIAFQSLLIPLRD